MNIQGNLTTTISATGNASVSRVQYDNVSGTIVVILSIQPTAGKTQTIQQTISGADVTALGTNWGDVDLLNWFVSKFNLTNADAAATPAAIAAEQTLEGQAAAAIAAAGGSATASPVNPVASPALVPP
jgi:hypothetical protein